jgi:hypothetical protein
MGVFFSKSELDVVKIHFLDGETSIVRTDCPAYLLQFMLNGDPSNIHLVCEQAEGLVCLRWFLGNRKLDCYDKIKLDRIRKANLYFRCSGMDEEIDLLLKPKDQSTQTYDDPNAVD